MDDKAERELVREIIQVEAEQDRITRYVAMWVSRNPRPQVTMDMLAEMKDILPRIEAWTDEWFFENAVARRAYILTFDGTFNGTRLLGNTLGGDPIFVMAQNDQEARRLAYDGIVSTIEHARQHYYNELMAMDPIKEGSQIEAGGRKDKDPFGVRSGPMRQIIHDLLKSRH